MAKTSFQLIPPEFDDFYSKTLASGDRFLIPTVRRKALFISRRRKNLLTQKSLIPSLSLVWNGFTQLVRDSWISAGAVCNLSGFKLFLKDTALRLKNDIAGYATPNDIYQAMVGRLHIEGTADFLEIVQLHPHTYWVQRKVRGTRNQYSPIEIIEDFDIPLQIKISYKIDCLDEDDFMSATFGCYISSDYQGKTFVNEFTIPLTINEDWQTATATFSDVIGQVRGYTAFIRLESLNADLYFDNVEIVHSGQNWARDRACNDINQSFTKAFYQIPKHWATEDLMEGAFFESFYYN